MNLPNILTGLRFLLVIPFIIFLTKSNPESIIISFLIYLLASITDYFDGYFARKLNCKSKIGAFLDPLADKILVLSAFIIFSFKKYVYLPFWLVIILAFRDYFITVLRIEVENHLKIEKQKKYNEILSNKKFKTSFTAKFKTTFQMLTIIIFYIVYLTNIHYIKFDFININSTLLRYIPLLFFIMSLILTYYSAIKYISSYLKASYLTIVKTFSTFFYLGYLTGFPGTFISLLVIIILYFLKLTILYYSIILFVVILIGTITSQITEKYENVIDPGYITIDEIGGVLISLLPFYLFIFFKKNYFTNNLYLHSNIIKNLYFIGSFLLFRFFDIMKPFGIKKIQKIGGGIGIMIDDLLAGFYVAIIMSLMILIKV